MTSGAIQHGVPTNVFLLILSFPHEPPRSIVAATPKSASNTDPSVSIRIFPACTNIHLSCHHHVTSLSGVNFNVTMNTTGTMYVLQRFCHLLHDNGNDHFIQTLSVTSLNAAWSDRGGGDFRVFVSHDVENRASIDKRLNKPQIFPHNKRRVQRENIRVIVETHGLCFMYHLFLYHISGHTSTVNGHTCRTIWTFILSRSRIFTATVASNGMHLACQTFKHESVERRIDRASNFEPWQSRLVQ